MTETNEETYVSVGLDVGSQNARIFISQKASAIPSIVPNEIGQRYTLALSTPEPEIEADPMNDQYWDKNQKKKDAKVKKEVHYLYGDAARKSLQREKKSLAQHTILNMVEMETSEDDAFDHKEACASFFQHLTSLTTNASHTKAQTLRYVLSIPPSQGDELASHAKLSEVIQNGLIKSIDQEGGYKKSDKKRIHSENRILSVLTHPISIAHAHKLFQDPSKSQNVLIVDWGAASLSMSHVKIVSGIAQIQEHMVESSLSGKNIVSLLVKHIAELFERKNRGIPPGEVLYNKKAKAKLEVAAEDALRTFGYSPKVTITIDGLFEGMDCHVDVMLARFEMLLGNILRSAEGKLNVFQGGVDKFDTVIGAGNIMRMKCVEKMMDRIFPKDKVSRGESTNVVPPEEAAAMGCAMYGSEFLSSTYRFSAEEEEDEFLDHGLVEEEVSLSPLSIGLSLVEGDPAAVIMIEEGMPLPALVTKMVDVSGCSGDSLDIVQIIDNEKPVGKIEGIQGQKEIEITMELTITGNLNVAVNGGPMSTI